MPAAIEVADIGLAHDGDGFRGSVFIFGVGGIWSRISSFLVAGRSSGSNGQDSGDQELKESIKIIVYANVIQHLLSRQFNQVEKCLPASCWLRSIG